MNKIIAFVALLLCISVGYSTWWDIAYNYKVQVNITNWSCDGAYCQFPINIGLNKTLTNGSDIRVVNANETSPLDFWRDDRWNYTNASGNLWVNASNQTTMVYVYYNATSSDASNIDRTFLFGDDFSSWNTTKQMSYRNASGGMNITNGVLNFTKGSLFLGYNNTTYNIPRGTVYAGALIASAAQCRLQTLSTTISDDNTGINNIDYNGAGTRQAYNGTTGFANNSAHSFPELMRITYSGMNITRAEMIKNTSEIASLAALPRIGTYASVGLGVIGATTICTFDFIIITTSQNISPTFTVGRQQTANENLTCLSITLPAISNSSQPLYANVSPVGIYLYNFTDYNGVVLQSSLNNTYSIPSSYNQTRIYVNAIGNNICTNYTLVFTSSQQTIQNNLVQSNITDWFNSYSSLILGIFTFGIAFGVTGKIGHTCLSTAVMWVALYLILLNPLFIYGAIALLIVGLVLTYANI